jgi:hypothetical protein
MISREEQRNETAAETKSAISQSRVASPTAQVAGLNEAAGIDLEAFMEALN